VTTLDGFRKGKSKDAALAGKERRAVQAIPASLWVPGLQRGQARPGGERTRPQMPLLDAAYKRPSTQLEARVD